MLRVARANLIARGEFAEVIAGIAGNPASRHAEENGRKMSEGISARLDGLTVLVAHSAAARIGATACRSMPTLGVRGRDTPGAPEVNKRI